MTTEIYKINDPASLTDDDLLALERAGKIIREGGLCAIPTETVYGLGASAYSSDAARAVFEAKGRPSDNPLIVHVSSPADAEQFAVVTDTYLRLAELFMPGPLTVILEKRDSIPPEVTGGLDTVAVRCPSHPVASALIKAAGVPVAAPSANLSGMPSPTKGEHVIRDMTGRVPMIIDGGDCTVGLESTVLRPLDDGSLKVLRPGGVTVEMLREAGFTVVTDKAVTDPSAVGDRPESPGMKYRHYAPAAEVVLLDVKDRGISFADAVLQMEEGRGRSFGVMCMPDEVELFPKEATVFSFRDSEEMAHTLFAALRGADFAGLSVIYVPLPETDGLGLAVYNRIIRAAGGKITRPEF